MPVRLFKKKANAGIVILPGYGRVADNTILSGERFAQFCPQFLEEVAEPVHVPAAAPKPALTEQKPVPALAVITEQLPAQPSAQALLEELPHPDKNSEVTEKVVSLGSKKNK